MNTFVLLPQVHTIQAHGETKSSVLIDKNRQVDLRVVEPKCFGAALLYFTGSKSFNIKLRQIAMKKGMKINEYGVFSVRGKKEVSIASKTEKECLRALGLSDIPPELREEMGEAHLFNGKKTPKLVTLKDIQGDLHVHSTYSDGKNSIAEMVQAAQSQGYTYLAISDHSARLKVAGGVSAQDLKKKKKEIDQLNKKLKNFRILFGTEVEIDTDGNLDYNDTILSQFDIVIAAIHTGFEQGQERLTKRLIKVCKSKHVHGIAHPLGGHIGKREPYTIDFKEFCKAAVDNNVFLEINAFPIRLDLNSTNAYFAKQQGVKFAIDTDAHNTNHLDYMKFGVTIARRAWCAKKDILNAQPVSQLIKSIKK